MTWKYNLEDDIDRWLLTEWIDFKFRQPDHRVTAAMQNLDMWNQDHMHDIFKKVEQ